MQLSLVVIGCIGCTHSKRHRDAYIGPNMITQDTTDPGINQRFVLRIYGNQVRHRRTARSALLVRTWDVHQAHSIRVLGREQRSIREELPSAMRGIPKQQRCL